MRYYLFCLLWICQICCLNAQDLSHAAVVDSLMSIISLQRDSIDSLSINSHLKIFKNQSFESGFIYASEYVEPIFKTETISFPNVWVEQDSTCSQIYEEVIVVKPGYPKISKNLNHSTRLSGLVFCKVEVPPILDTIKLVRDIANCTGWESKVYTVETIRNKATITPWQIISLEKYNSIGLLQLELEKIGYLKKNYELNVMDRNTKKAISKFKKTIDYKTYKFSTTEHILRTLYQYDSEN